MIFFKNLKEFYILGKILRMKNAEILVFISYVKITLNMYIKVNRKICIFPIN